MIIRWLRLALLALLCFCATGISAQTPTVVTGTIVDPAGIPYSFANVSAQLIPTTASPTVIVNGIPTGIGGQSNATADANGKFSMNLFCNTASGGCSVISPSGTQWQFTVQTNGVPLPQGTGPQSCVALITVTGASQTVTANFSGCPALTRGSSSVSPGWTLSLTPCGSNAQCTQISGNGHVVTDVTTASGSSTITCPNSDCNFTGTDVYGRPMMQAGQKIWATTPGSGVGIGFMTFTVFACPTSTVASFTAQSVTLTAANDCTANQTANAILIWGTDDGLTLHNLAAGCWSYQAPSNINIITSRGFLTVLPPCATGGLASGTGVPLPALFSPLGTNDSIIMTPDFNYADCTGTGAQTGVCIGSGLAQMQNFLIWGTGLTSAANANCPTNKTILAMQASAGQIINVDLAGICPGASGVTGVELNSLDEKYVEGGAQNVGTTACLTSSKAVETENLDCHQLGQGTSATFIGLNVLASGQQTDIGTYIYDRVSVSGKLQTRGAHFVNNNSVVAFAVHVLNGGSWLSDGDFLGVDLTTPLSLLQDAGSTVSVRNTQFNSSSQCISQAGLLIDQGGNACTGGGQILSNSGSQYRGEQVLSVACSGTATASSTLGLSPLGGPCTSTTVTSGRAMTAPGTLFALNVTAGTAGVNASSGVVTVLKNGVATTMTCTLGTTTACSDPAHLPTYAVGDTISIQFTTQIAETLANVRATVLAW